MSIIRFKQFEKSDQWGNIAPRINVFSEFHFWFFTCLRAIAIMPDPDTPKEIVITSLNDSLHMKNSRHYNDEAADIRSKNFLAVNHKVYFMHRLASLLNSHPDDPNKFTVLFENEGAPEEHFHCQIRKGQSFMRF